MGWVKGFGQSLLRDLLLCVQPQHVVALQSGNPVRDLPYGTSWIGDGPALPPWRVIVQHARPFCALALTLTAPARQNCQ